MLSEKLMEVIRTQTQEGAKVTKMTLTEFAEVPCKPPGSNKPCLTHWEYKPKVVGGVEHCGKCGAITGSIDHLYKIWFKCKVALGLVSESQLKEVEQ